MDLFFKPNIKETPTSTTENQQPRKKRKKKKLRFDQLTPEDKDTTIEENGIEMTAVVPLNSELSDSISTSDTKKLTASKGISELSIANNEKHNHTNGLKSSNHSVASKSEDDGRKQSLLPLSTSPSLETQKSTDSQHCNRIVRELTVTQNGESVDSVHPDEDTQQGDQAESNISTQLQSAETEAVQSTEVPPIITRTSTPLESRASTPPSARWRSIRHAVKVSSLTKKRQEDSFMEK